jgi:hypothetical protein
MVRQETQAAYAIVRLPNDTVSMETMQGRMISRAMNMEQFTDLDFAEVAAEPALVPLCIPQITCYLTWY